MCGVELITGRYESERTEKKQHTRQKKIFFLPLSGGQKLSTKRFLEIDVSWSFKLRFVRKLLKHNRAEPFSVKFRIVTEEILKGFFDC